MGSANAVCGSAAVDAADASVWSICGGDVRLIKIQFCQLECP